MEVNYAPTYERNLCKYYFVICTHVLKGIDYLPSSYHNMLKDEKRFLIVAEVQTEIVSSVCNNIKDSVWSSKLAIIATN